MVRTETPVHPKGTNRPFLKVGKCLLGAVLFVLLGTLPLTAWAGDFPGKGSRAKWEEAAQIVSKAIEQVNKSDFQSAKSSLEKAISIYDQDPSFYFNLGFVYRKMNQLNQAEYYYNQALRVNPNYGKAWINLGWIYNSQDKIQDSLKAYKKAEACNLSLKDKEGVSSAINVVETKLALSRAEDSYKQDKYDKALIDLDKAVALDKKNGEAYYLRGKAHEKLGKTSEAQSDFARSKELDYKPKQGE